VILIDANLLIYAVDADSHHHEIARRWLEETLSSTTSVGLAWIVILAFLRITTRAAVFQQPLTPERSLDYVDSWLRQPYVTAVSPGDQHWAILSNLLRTSGTAANLTSDAHLAALAIELGVPIYSTDNDFRRFHGVQHINPLD
jgi:toxin-antitoxin system PIN domain toxin